jgi:hypothetical protein
VKTLELFAYGTFRDYSSDPGSYLELNSNQLTKLKQLTLVSFGSSRNVKKTLFEFLTALFRSSLNIPCSRRLWISPIPGTWSHSSSMPFIMSTDLPDSPRHIKVLSSLSLSCLYLPLSLSVSVAQDLINGKLDQKNRLFRVRSCSSRSVRQEEIQGLIDQLLLW